MKHYFKHKMRGKSPGTIVAMVLFGIVAIVGLAILFGFAIMWLWNTLMPELFGLPTLTYWQAVGLFILSKILIGCGSSGRGSSHHKKHDSECKDGKKKRTDFSKWDHYDKFWEEKGDEAYTKYVEELEAGKETSKEDQLDKKDE